MGAVALGLLETGTEGWGLLHLPRSLGDPWGPREVPVAAKAGRSKPSREGERHSHRQRCRSRGCRLWTDGASESAGHGTKKKKKVLNRKANPSWGAGLPSPLLAESRSPAYSGKRRPG